MRPRRVVDWFETHMLKRPSFRRSYAPDIWLLTTLLSVHGASYRIGRLTATGQLTAGQFVMLLVWVALAAIGAVIVWAHLAGTPRVIVKHCTITAGSGLGLVINADRAARVRVDR